MCWKAMRLPAASCPSSKIERVDRRDLVGPKIDFQLQLEFKNHQVLTKRIIFVVLKNP